MYYWDLKMHLDKHSSAFSLMQMFTTSDLFEEVAKFLSLLDIIDMQPLDAHVLSKMNAFDLHNKE